MARSSRRSTRNDVQQSPRMSPLSSNSSPPTTETVEHNDENCPACPIGSAHASNPFSKEQWVRCDVCMTWYHWRCAGSGGDLDVVDKWSVVLLYSLPTKTFQRYCSACLEANPNLSITFKAPARKSIRKRTQRDYANLNSGFASDPRRWSRLLEHKTFKEDPFKRLAGSEVRLEWLEEDQAAMTEPIIIEHPDGLGMTMPSSDFTVDDIVELVGKDTPVEVIGMTSQLL